MSAEVGALSRKSLRTPTAGSQGMTNAFSEGSLAENDPTMAETYTHTLFMKS